MFIPNVGMPRISAEKIAGPERRVSANGYLDMIPVGRVIDGTKTRDPSADTVYTLRAGLLMGIVTASGKYANSFFGTTAGALAGAGTSVSVAVAEAAEIVRRRGATGTLTITGPDRAGGTPRQKTLTYSAVDLGTGAVTITAPGNKNQIEHIRFNAPATGGNVQLTVQKTDGTSATTANAAWNATDATFLGTINTQLDAATGVAGGVVASAISGVDPDHGIQLTYSGTGYAGKTWTPAAVAVFPTGPTDATYVAFQAADGSFVAGSLIGDVDGSQVPVTFLPDGWGEYVPADGTDVPFAYLPVGGILDESNLLPWPADAGLRQWVRDKLNVNARFTYAGKF